MKRNCFTCIFTISLCLFQILYRLVMRLLICQLYLYLFIFSLFFNFCCGCLLSWAIVCCDGIFHRCSAWALSLQLWSLWGVFTGGGFKMCVLWTWDTCIVVIAHVCTDLNKKETNSGVFVLLFAMTQRCFVRLLRMSCMWGFWNVCSLFCEWLDSNDQIFWDEEKMSKYSSGMYFIFFFHHIVSGSVLKSCLLTARSKIVPRETVVMIRNTLFFLLFSVWLSIAVGNRKQ